MEKIKSRVPVIFLTAILFASVMPSNVAAQNPVAENFAFGIEYDWSNMNSDYESMTGLPLDDILADIMQSADDAGIELVILEELTGTSSLIIDQYQDGETMLSYNGESVEVTKHVTELTVRHGDVQDLAIITEWSDARAGWDLTASLESEGVFNIDAYYVEYRDAEGLLYGHDLEMSMDSDQKIEFGLYGSFEAQDGEKVMPLNIQMEMGVDYSVSNAESSILYTEPSDIFQQLSALEGGDDLGWEVTDPNNNDNYVNWYELDSNDYTCTWESMYEEYDCYHDYYNYSSYYPYCEYYSAFDTYYCTYDFGQDSAWEDSLSWTHRSDETSPNMGDSAQPHSGQFSTATGFNFELTGLPAEEFGLPTGKWDISASDSTSDTGSFTDEGYECAMGIELFEGTQMITTDGEQIEVMQAYTSPLPWGMTCHIGNLFMHAFEGTEDAPTLADMIEDSTEEIADSMGEGSESDSSSDQISVSMSVESQDEIDVRVNAWGFEEDNDYEVIVVMTDSNGISQDSASMVVYDSYYFSEEDTMSASDWGEHCVTAQLKDVTNNDIVDSATTCAEVSQEPEPSDLVEDIMEGFSESTLENVLENFASNLEYRLEDYEADFPYDDGDMFILWDTNNNMVVGFQLVVTSDNSNLWYTLVGPESDSYGSAPSPVSITYFSGQQAIVQEAEISDYSTLEDLVDLTLHNDEVIEEAVEESLADNPTEAGGPSEETGEGSTEEEGETVEGGLLPFLSPAMTIAMIAIAGLVATIRSRNE